MDSNWKQTLEEQTEISQNLLCRLQIRAAWVKYINILLWETQNHPQIVPKSKWRRDNQASLVSHVCWCVWVNIWRPRRPLLSPIYQPAVTIASTSAVQPCEATRWREHPTPEWLGRISSTLPPSPHSYHTDWLTTLWLRPSLSAPPLLPPLLSLSLSYRLWSDVNGCRRWRGFLQHCFHPSSQILIRPERKEGGRGSVWSVGTGPLIIIGLTIIRAKSAKPQITKRHITWKFRSEVSQIKFYFFSKELNKILILF